MHIMLDEQLAALRPGHVLRTRAGARIQVQSALGAGNEGVVFKAAMGSGCVALKLFKKDSTGRREQRTVAITRLNLSRSLTPSVAGPFDVVNWEGRIGHVAPLVQGISVGELVENPALLSPRQRVVASIKLGGLLLQLHRRGLAFGDLNKGAVKLLPKGTSNVDVGLVDLDSMVLRDAPPPLTLGTPDTCAPEMRRGEQPATLAAWQAADWTAYGHVVLELLLAKTAACGIDDPVSQVNAYMGIPPCLLESSRGRAIDLASGLPAQALPVELRRPLTRLFDVNPQRRCGTAFVQAMTSELINNHQVGCSHCGLQYFVHHDLNSCPGCGASAKQDYKVILPNGSCQRLCSQGLMLTRRLFGGNPQVDPMHVRLFTMGGVPFVCAHGATALRRKGASFLLPTGLHVPLIRGDRICLAAGAEVLVQ